jgi:hypothetical protein
MNSYHEENIQSNEEYDVNIRSKNKLSKDSSGKLSYEPSFPSSNITKTVGSSNTKNLKTFPNPYSNNEYTEKRDERENNNIKELIYQENKKDYKNDVNTNNRLNNNDINNNISEQEKINDDLSSNDQESRKGKKTRYNQNPMERISEVEGEDDKYTTIFDKINDDAIKNDYRINEDNYRELIDKNITSENVKYLFHPTLFDTEESKNKYHPEINKNSKIILAEKERNKSSDNTQRSKQQPIEVIFSIIFFKK